MEDLHFNVWDIEQFFECHANWDKYEDFYYDYPFDEFLEKDDPPYYMSLAVCDFFDLPLFSNGCSRVVVEFGDYVAKLCIEKTSWDCANDRELELINLLQEKGRTDLLEYLVPIVGSVHSKRFSDSLVTIFPICDDLDSNREVLSPDYALKLSKEIHGAFLKVGIEMCDIEISSNYGFYKGKWRLLDFAEWIEVEDNSNSNCSTVFN